MKFTSNWSHGAVFWRSFTKNDTLYLVGLRQGTLHNGDSADYDNPTGYFQLELKRGDLFGSTLIAAGHVYTNDDEYILTDGGGFLPVEDAVTVVVTGPQYEPAGHVVQFFSAAGADSTIKITSQIEQTIDQNGSSKATVSSEASDENGASVGAKETAGGGKMPLGLELTEGASSKVASKISREIESQVGLTVSTVSTYSEDQTITLSAHKLTALRSSWQREYVTGTAALGPTHFVFSATLKYITSRQATEYDSADQLPPDLMAAYREQDPAYHPPVNLQDGAVVREENRAPVYVVFGGAKFWVPTPEILTRLYGGWGSVVLVADGALAAVPTTPQDGTVLREEHHPEVWLFASGTKRHITTSDVLSRYGGWGVVHVVWDDALSGFPEGEPVV